MTRAELQVQWTLHDTEKEFGKFAQKWTLFALYWYPPKHSAYQNQSYARKQCRCIGTVTFPSSLNSSRYLEAYSQT